MSLARPRLRIVLGEDDDGHALLVQKNLGRTGLTNENDIVRLRDGRAVLAHFAAESGKPETSGPCLLLLDINMPHVDGIEVLRQLKANTATLSLPVIMLTTTDNPREVARCYELGCNLYLTKPVVYEQFVDAISRLGMFLAVVRVPDHGRS